MTLDRQLKLADSNAGFVDSTRNGKGVAPIGCFLFLDQSEESDLGRQLRHDAEGAFQIKSVIVGFSSAVNLAIRVQLKITSKK